MGNPMSAWAGGQSLLYQRGIQQEMNSCVLIMTEHSESVPIDRVAIVDGRRKGIDTVPDNCQAGYSPISFGLNHDINHFHNTNERRSARHVSIWHAECCCVIYSIGWIWCAVNTTAMNSWPLFVKVWHLYRSLSIDEKQWKDSLVL